MFLKPEGAYFLTHSAGCLPASSAAILQQQVLQPWQTKGGNAWDEWLKVIEGFHQALGQLLNSNAENFCGQLNLSSGLTKILFSLPMYTGKNVILLTEQDFPSMSFVLQQAEKAGWQCRFLPLEADLTDQDVWAEAMRADVGIVFATHVYSNSSMRAPLSFICDEARQRNIISIIDVAQSVGAFDIDLTALNPDFALGTSLKYFCGGPGAAWLYASPQIIDQCHPLDVGWFSHENPFEFDIHHFAYAKNASRFMGGTPSVLPFALAANSINLLLQTGSKAIETHNQSALQSLIDYLPPDRIVSEIRPGRRGSHLLFRPQDIDHGFAKAKQARLLCDIRNEALRLSVHFYTTEEEIAAALNGLSG